MNRYELDSSLPAGCQCEEPKVVVMRFHVFGLVLVLALFGAACDDNSTRTTIITPVAEVAAPILSLTESVEFLYAALDAGDFSAVEPFVDMEGLVVLSAIESASSQSLHISVDMRSQMSANFWTSFLETSHKFEDGMSNVAVAEGQLLTIDGQEFQVVVVSDDNDNSEAIWVFHKTDTGWVVDPIATFGSSFAGPVEAWLERLPEDERLGATATVAERLLSWNVLLSLQEDSESGVAVRAILERLIPQFEVVNAASAG